MSRRLSGIVDLSGCDDGFEKLRSAQPEATIEKIWPGFAVAYSGVARPREAGAIGCLLDGAVYNLTEIAEKAGIPPDIPAEESLAAAYSCWEGKLFECLRGDFAVLLWNRRSRSAILVRDPLGGRSLFYSLGRSIAFSSEVGDLLKLLPRTPKPDPITVGHWLVETTVPPGRTHFDRIDSLQAGCCLAVDPAGARERRYWSPTYAPPVGLGADEAADAIGAAVQRSVRRAVGTGEHYGVMLSGGLDSSAVAAAAVGPDGPLRGEELGTYSVVFPDDPAIDESDLIAGLNTSLGTRGRRLPVRGGSMLAGAIEFSRRWAVPLPTPNFALWQPLLSQARADGVTVMLDGQGGDELWGFSPYLVADRLRHGRPLSALQITRRMLAEAGLTNLTSKAFREWGLRASLPYAVHSRLQRESRRFGALPGWLSASTAQTFLMTDDQWAWKRLSGPRWWAYQVDLLTRYRESIGMRELLRRRASMMGLQTRSPLIDVDLVELVLSLEPELSVGDKRDRPLIRAAMADRIPDSVRLRSAKPHFTPLMHRCMTGEDWSLVTKLLDSQAEVGAFVDLSQVHRELLEPKPGNDRPGWSRLQRIWALVTLEVWLQQLGAGPPSQHVALAFA